jgi:hypothetical protein
MVFLFSPTAAPFWRVTVHYPIVARSTEGCRCLPRGRSPRLRVFEPKEDIMQEIRPVPDEGPDEQREPSDPPATDALIDEAEDESFPASDAPAYSQREPKDAEERETERAERRDVGDAREEED